MTHDVTVTSRRIVIECGDEEVVLDRRKANASTAPWADGHVHALVAEHLRRCPS